MYFNNLCINYVIYYYYFYVYKFFLVKWKEMRFFNGAMWNKFVPICYKNELKIVWNGNRLTYYLSRINKNWSWIQQNSVGINEMFDLKLGPGYWVWSKVARTLTKCWSKIKLYNCIELYRAVSIEELSNCIEFS